MQNKLALVIGIDRYYDNTDKQYFLEQLPSCKKDAIDLSKILLKTGFKIYCNQPIIGSKLTENLGWTEIRKSIHNFFDDARADQSLLFYFSGHGIFRNKEVYLATPELQYFYDI